MGLPGGKNYHGRIHIWDYPKRNQAIRTPSPVQGLTGDPGELTPVLGLASDCSAQRLVRQGDGLHYPVGQHLFGDSLPFLLNSVADKELLRASEAPGAVHVYAHRFTT